MHNRLYDWEGAVKPDARAVIIAAAEEARYIYVPTNVLEQPYTGPGAEKTRASWGQVLFDYQ